MSKIERFEEPKSWQMARLLVNLVYDLTNRSAFEKDFQLKNEI